MGLGTDRLLRVGQAKAKEQQAWSEGVSLRQSAGVELEHLRLRVASARFALAKEMLQQAEQANKSTKIKYRLIISRAYYAMYHAVRAAAFVHYRGDDHEPHRELPGKVPSDFPNAQIVGNELKSAREYRNQADYDPYPRVPKYWAGIAATVYADAKALLPNVAVYLKNKGCKL